MQLIPLELVKLLVGEAYCQGLSETLKNYKMLCCTCSVLAWLEIQLNSFYSHPGVGFSRWKVIVCESRINNIGFHKPFVNFSVILDFSEILQCVYWDRSHPDNDNQSDGKTETIDAIINFQIQPIKCSVQNNEISTCSLWCLRDNTVSLEPISKL